MYINVNQDLFILMLMSLPFLKRTFDLFTKKQFKSEDKWQILYYLIFLGLYLERFYNKDFFLDFYNIPIIYVLCLILDFEVRRRFPAK